MYPTVIPLPVHMPDMQFMRFKPKEKLGSIVFDERRSRTMLTEFFRIHRERPDGPKYVYTEFPEYFVWDAAKKEWKDRKKGIAVGRLVFASPIEGQKYYLRLLLANVAGVRSFDDLLTVDNYKCETFQESALRRGLLEEDNSIEQCMNEGVEMQMPQALRGLFATLLIFCQLSDPQALWEKYYQALSEDYRHKYPDDDAKVLQVTTQEVEQLLESMGKSFKHFNLQHLSDLQDDGLRRTRDIIDALNAPVPSIYVDARKQLNTEQRGAYKCIIHHVKVGKPGAFFIDGPGGTGKTFLYCALYARVRSMGKIVLPTATPGIAASNMPTGRTAHSRFKIPTDSNSSLTCDVPKQSSVAGLLQQAALIIWDEASMAKKENIEALDMLLRDLCSVTQPFGGKVIVFGGDFRQVLSVLPRRTQHEAVEASLVSSYLWPVLKKFKLTENIRAREDLEFSEFLLQLGNGALQREGKGDSLVELPNNLMIPFEEHNNSFNKLVHSIFPEIQQPSFDPNIVTERAILTPKNDEVDSINELLIDQFPGDSYIYKSFDSVVDDNCNNYPCEFLNTLCPGGMSPHKLVLKRNCPVILLRNLDPATGLCNGTRLVCKKFFPNLIQCKIATGYYKGEHVFLPRIILRPSVSVNYPFQFQRKKFPIKLSFAMTINKAQGQTLQQAGVYLQQPYFSHGQLYVALSRARKASQLMVLAKPLVEQPNCISFVKNMVSFEILRRAEII